MTTILGAVDNVALCTAIGALACLMWILPRPLDDRHAPGAGQVWCLLGGCLALLTLTSAAMLIQRAHVLSGQPYSALTPVLPQVLNYTHYGHVWLIRVATILALWPIWWLGRGRTRRRPWAGAMSVIIAVTAFTRSATGHSADHGDFTAHEIMDWLHIMVGSLWAGAVVASALTLFRAPRQEAAAGGLSDIALRLSQLATAALVMVLATGLYNAVVQLNGLASLWRTEYGRHLALKVSLVGVMLGLGAVNRFLYLWRLPGLARGERPVPAGAGGTGMRRFVQVLYLEAWVALGILISAAVLINTAPPHPSPSM